MRLLGRRIHFVNSKTLNRLKKSVNHAKRPPPFSFALASELSTNPQRETNGLEQTMKLRLRQKSKRDGRHGKLLRG